MATDDANKGSSGESPFESAKKAFGDSAASFTEQAGARAREYTAQGKDRAVEALDGVAGLVGDAAGQVSERLGEQYGGYVRQAADAVSGLAETLRSKDPDELFDDARNVVRSSPAIAIAAAAAVGFLMARVVKSGLAPAATNDGQPGSGKPETGTAGGVSGREAAPGGQNIASMPEPAVGETPAHQGPPATDNAPPAA